MKTSCKPVFIVGVMRSGTSLLHALLNHHSAMALMYESDVWNFPKSFANWRFRNNWLERQELFNQCLSRHRLVLGGSLRGLEKIRTPDELYETYSSLKPAPLCGEKSPFYCTRLEQLSRQYPQATFIIMWRDPLEFCRSAAKAAQTSPFFSKRGMFSRLIHHQEQLIRQSARLEQRGARVFRLDYAELVDDPEAVCRRLCAFLGLEFEPQMLRLSEADISAVNPNPHHDFLRRGIIERQQYTEQLLTPANIRKLSAYRARWERLQSKWLGSAANTARPPEPGWLERLSDTLAGRFFNLYDDVVRLGFEFLPLPWLLTYRHFKRWLFKTPLTNSPPPAAAASRREQLPSIIAAFAYLVLLVSIQFHVNPRLMTLPLYILPCVGLALVSELRWATLFTGLCAVVAPLVQGFNAAEFKSPDVLLWNSAMRFIFIEALVLLFARIRLEIISNEKPQPGNHP